jgi:hypothetical protein
VSRRPPARTLLIVALNLVVAGALLEGLFFVLIHVPRMTADAPAPVRRLAQQMYRHFTRGLIQFDPGCARYDPEVTYTLAPGSCTFGNVEFNDTYLINSLGVRDSEAALHAPEIVVLGDSHAMGWGVGQDEHLAAVVRKGTGRKVLNAAVSSYATVRELRMLDRVDTSHLRVLLIQYADNDLVENQTFRESGNTLPITSRDRYDEIVRHYVGQRSYYPGKYVFRLVMKVLRLEPPEPDRLTMDVVPPSEEAAIFLNALTHAGRTPLDDVQIIVFAVNQSTDLSGIFATALAQEIRKPRYPPFVQRIVALNTARLLKEGDFYVLDDHMNANGHRVVGERLAEIVSDMLVEH